MHVVAAFQHSIPLETALAGLENAGVPRKDILALPLDRRDDAVHLFDTMHHSDGESLIELAAILGMIGMLLGSIYGFVLAWGPILCALCGLVGGALIGYGISALRLRNNRKRNQREQAHNLTEVVVLVRCADWQVDTVKQTLWQGNALGVAVYKAGNPKVGRDEELG